MYSFIVAARTHLSINQPEEELAGRGFSYRFFTQEVFADNWAIQFQTDIWISLDGFPLAPYIFDLPADAYLFLPQIGVSVSDILGFELADDIQVYGIKGQTHLDYAAGKTMSLDEAEISIISKNLVFKPTNAADQFLGTNEADLVRLKGGADVFIAMLGDDRIYGGAGDDVLVSYGFVLSSPEDFFHGGIGNDLIDGGRGDDTLKGGAGNDRIAGDEGDDVLDGGAGNDLLAGDGHFNFDRQSAPVPGFNLVAQDQLVLIATGNDTLLGKRGHDSLYGNSGQDVLKGGTGRDNLSGGAGRDALFGGSGRDYLEGGADQDTLSGGKGRDTLFHNLTSLSLTQENADSLSGGAQSDTFVFGVGSLPVALTDNVQAVVTDFTRGVDKINLDLGTGTLSRKKFEWVGLLSPGEIPDIADLQTEGIGYRQVDGGVTLVGLERLHEVLFEGLKQLDQVDFVDDFFT